MSGKVVDEVQLGSIQQLTVDRSRLRVVCYCEHHDSVELDQQTLQKAVEDWLDGRNPLLAVVGIKRVEVYEFPPAEEKTSAG